MNKQAVGYPKSKDDSDVRLLQLHFPKENHVKIALHLSFRFQSINQIHEKTKKLYTKEELENFLVEMARIRCIYQRKDQEELQYALIPLVIGLYELKGGELTPEYVKVYDDYDNTSAYGLEFLSSKVSQMRTIPIEESITPEHKIATYNQVMKLVNENNGPFALLKCVCRERQKILGENCKKTTREYVCLAMGMMASQLLFSGIGKELTQQEAIETLTLNQKEGLVLQPSGGQIPEFICSCCGCCCGILRLQKQLPYPAEFWTHDFYAELITEKCVGCGLCEKSCQVNAITINGESKKAKIDLNRCIGCGICVTVCNQGALSLKPVEKPSTVPKDYDQLYEHIYNHKKGPLQKFLMGQKLKKGKHWR
ncbi:MAG: 4Fe-4S dicluster domain-containing protein [Candidatus Lokiarchaeota archaeon]|nr:4Fe-4S dicluster domain-containing protein [Candidatus Lokiarchaeota archaeon]